MRFLEIIIGPMAKGWIVRGVNFLYQNFGGQWFGGNIGPIGERLDSNAVKVWCIAIGTASDKAPFPQVLACA